MRVDYQSGINQAVSTIGNFALKEKQISKQAKIDENQAKISEELQKQQADRDRREDEYKSQMLQASQLSATSAEKQATTMQQFVENMTGIKKPDNNGIAPLPNEAQIDDTSTDPEPLSEFQRQQIDQITNDIVLKGNRGIDLNDENAISDFIISLGNQFGGDITKMPNGLNKEYVLAMTRRGLYSSSYTESNNKATGKNEIVETIYDYPHDPTRNSTKGSNYHKVTEIRYARGNKGSGEPTWNFNENFHKDATPDAQRMREKRESVRDEKRAALENKLRAELNNKNEQNK